MKASATLERHQPAASFQIVRDFFFENFQILGDGIQMMTMLTELAAGAASVAPVAQM